MEENKTNKELKLEELEQVTGGKIEFTPTRKIEKPHIDVK